MAPTTTQSFHPQSPHARTLPSPDGSGEMSYRSLGNSGLMVSEIGLGCNNFGRPGSATEGQAGTDAVIGAAIDAGITLFDTADMYGSTFGGSEELMGQSLGARRNDIVLASKFGYYGVDTPIREWGSRANRGYIRRAVEGSLTRLRTDWIDLYQLHAPDPITPIGETIVALDELVREGKIRYIGHSNLSGWQIAEAHYVAQELGSTAFISAQNEFSLVRRHNDAEVLPAAARFGLGMLPFFPLANGLLTGKFHRDDFPADSRIMRQRPHVAENANWDALDAYRAHCEVWGITMLQATFGWMLAHEPIASVIAGATTPEQVRQNAQAATGWRPTAEQYRIIDELFPAPEVLPV